MQLFGRVTVNSQWVPTRATYYRSRFGWRTNFRINGGKWTRSLDPSGAKPCEAIPQRETSMFTLMKYSIIANIFIKLYTFSSYNFFFFLSFLCCLAQKASGTARVHLWIYNDGKTTLPKFIAHPKSICREFRTSFQFIEKGSSVSTFGWLDWTAHRVSSVVFNFGNGHNFNLLAAIFKLHFIW